MAKEEKKEEVKVEESYIEKKFKGMPLVEKPKPPAEAAKASPKH